MENVDGALQVRSNYESGKETGSCVISQIKTTIRKMEKRNKGKIEKYFLLLVTITIISVVHSRL